ncbi:MAG TPA: hypothetical protein VGY53_11830 [Isosphaeraceae bacterium]|nr:hypothetical protein [Isosphaeraceae bacterium]
MREPTQEDVDAAVREVLAAFGLNVKGRGCSVADFSERLLSLRGAQSLPFGIRSVRVRPGTVVTPLAAEYLKQQGIALQLGNPRELASNAASAAWGLATDDPSGLVLAVRRSLLEGPDPWFDLGSESCQATRWLLEAPGRGAAFLTAEAAVATWQANQVPGIRAATVSDAGAVARAATGLGANLIVIEPAGHSIAGLKHVLATFRRAGPPQAPAWLAGGTTHAHRRSDRPRDSLQEPQEPPVRPARAGTSPAARSDLGGRGGAW